MLDIVRVNIKIVTGFSSVDLFVSKYHHQHPSMEIIIMYLNSHKDLHDLLIGRLQYISQIQREP